MYLEMSLQPTIFFGLVSVQVVQYHVDLATRVSGDDLVHKIQELAAATTAIVAGFHLSRDDVQGREQGRGSMPRIPVAEAVHRLSIRQTNPALGPLQGLDRGLLIHRQN